MKRVIKGLATKAQLKAPEMKRVIKGLATKDELKALQGHLTQGGKCCRGHV